MILKVVFYKHFSFLGIRYYTFLISKVEIISIEYKEEKVLCVYTIFNIIDGLVVLFMPLSTNLEGRQSIGLKDCLKEDFSRKDLMGDECKD